MQSIVKQANQCSKFPNAQLPYDQLQKQPSLNKTYLYISKQIQLYLQCSSKLKSLDKVINTISRTSLRRHVVQSPAAYNIFPTFFSRIYVLLYIGAQLNVTALVLTNEIHCNEN